MKFAEKSSVRKQFLDKKLMAFKLGRKSAAIYRLENLNSPKILTDRLPTRKKIFAERTDFPMKRQLYKICVET